MDSGSLSVLSTLAGAAVGGGLSVLASWTGNRKQARAQWLVQVRARREDAYKEFIEAAANCYIDALLHDKPDIPATVDLYSKMSRIRVLATRPVVRSAQDLIARILHTYAEPVRSISELAAIEDGSLDIIVEFSEQCRKELDALRLQI